MRPVLPQSQDFWAGVLFVFFGSLAIWLARGYPMGTASRMGAGYYPTVVAGLLCLFGIGLAVRGLMLKGNAVTRGALRPFLVLVGVVAFGVLLAPAGLVVATAVLLALGALASHQSRLLESVVATLALTAFAVVAFVWGLGLPISIWPRW